MITLTRHTATAFAGHWLGDVPGSEIFEPVLRDAVDRIFTRLFDLAGGEGSSA